MQSVTEVYPMTHIVETHKLALSLRLWDNVSRSAVFIWNQYLPPIASQAAQAKYG